ncbi:histidine kinase [Nonomuraea sp. NPDC050310]|uniref:sensor histidine kinase n=1 Tax=Nonomuraea sp. NPDC050310 TaxID=3154935 RepID=UPI0033C33C02
MKTFALVCGLTVLVVSTGVIAYGNQPEARPIDVLGYALLVAMCASLLWLRARPEPALAGSLGATGLYFVQGYAYSLWPAAALLAVHVTISSGRRLAGWTGVGILVGVPAVAVLLEPEVDNAVALFVWVLLVLVVAQPAEVSRARREYVTAVEQRAAEAERTREEEALRRAQEERLKVARELHDVTSHTVSVIALHAAVAAEAVERAGGPPEAREALQVIRTASREALAEMKAVLGVLRPPPTEPQTEPQPDTPTTRLPPGPGHPLVTRPLPGSGELPDLLATATLPVSLDVRGEPRPLPPAVDLTVYRVVQEALTNTMRHAAATSASVRLDYADGSVTVQVDDDGAGGHSPPGHGLTGMAERVNAVGGRLSTGTRPGGGFRVTARLPVGEEHA